MQREVALVIGVSEDTITYWKNGRFTPRIEHFLAIIGFLEYNPFAIEGIGIGSRIYQYRVENRPSYRNLAKLTRFDPGSLERWEKTIQKPLAKSQKRLEQFFTPKELS
jgi:transcriptional regulator with XRE-family HTH domain